MANEPEDEALEYEERIFTPAAVAEVNAPPTVPIPTTEAERAALEAELANYSRKKLAQAPAEEAAAFHVRRYQICLALDGIVYDRATLRIPKREEERAALEHELANPDCYCPNKIIELMTWEEESVFKIRRRQIMAALRGDPDDTTEAARDLVRRCCGQK